MDVQTRRTTLQANVHRVIAELRGVELSVAVEQSVLIPAAHVYRHVYEPFPVAIAADESW